MCKNLEKTKIPLPQKKLLKKETKNKTKKTHTHENEKQKKKDMRVPLI